MLLKSSTTTLIIGDSFKKLLENLFRGIMVKKEKIPPGM
jgi:hypothetical protein